MGGAANKGETMKKHDRFDYALRARALEVLRQSPAGTVLTMVEALAIARAERMCDRERFGDPCHVCDKEAK